MSGDQRRLLIQREAGRLFARSGYAATTLDDIAAAAGVTKPMVYRHFVSKKALYLALLAKHENDLPTFFERIDADSLDGTPQTLLRAILDVWFDYVWENRHAWVMLFRDSSGDADIQRFRRRVSASARRVLAEFIARATRIRDPAGPGRADRRAAEERPGRAGALVDRQPRHAEAAGARRRAADEPARDTAGMTQEDEGARLWEERLRAGYEAFNREEFDDSLEFMHPDIEWHRGAVSIEGGVIRGRDQVRALMTPDMFDRQEIKVGEIQTNGEKVLVETTFRVRGRSSGIELENRGWQVWTVRDNLAVRVELYDEEAEALAAAGLDGDLSSRIR